MMRQMKRSKLVLSISCGISSLSVVIPPLDHPTGRLLLRRDFTVPTHYRRLEQRGSILFQRVSMILWLAVSIPGLPRLGMPIIFQSQFSQEDEGAELHAAELGA